MATNVPGILQQFSSCFHIHIAVADWSIHLNGQFNQPPGVAFSLLFFFFFYNNLPVQHNVGHVNHNTQILKSFQSVCHVIISAQC